MTNERKKHFKQMAADFYYVVVPVETVDWIEGTAEDEEYRIGCSTRCCVRKKLNYMKKCFYHSDRSDFIVSYEGMR